MPFQYPVGGDSDYRLRTGDVARLFGVSTQTVYRWERRGWITPIRLPSGDRRFSLREIEALLRAGGGR